MLSSLDSLLHCLTLYPCRLPVKLLIALCVLGVPGALQAQTLTYLGMQSQIPYSGILAPVSVAVDSVGNLYVADAALSSIVKIAPNGTQSSVGAGLQNPAAVAVDLAGNVYVTSNGSNQVIEIALNGTQSIVPFIGLVLPFGIAVDSAGAIYVSDEEIGVVIRLPVSGPQTTIGSGFDTPAGLALDSTGNLYVADGAGPVYKVTPGGIQTQVGYGFTNPNGVAVDARDVVYVSDGNFPSGDIYEMEGNTPVALGFGPASGVAVNTSGGLVGVPVDDGTVVKVNLGAVDFGSANVCPGTATMPTPCSQSLTLKFVVPATQISIAFSSPSDLVVTNGGQNLDFTTTANTCTSLSFGATECSITIQFKPLGPGIRSGALDVIGSLNGGPAVSLITVPIHGLGLASLAGFDSELISTLPVPFPPSYFATGVTPDSEGNLFIAENSICVIQKWTALTGVLSTIAGTGTCGSAEASNGLLATAATFPSAWKPVVDGRGDVYFSDISDSVIWKVDALTGIANIYAGTLQTSGQAGDGGLAANALFFRPYTMAGNGAGDLYVTDFSNNTVRRIDGTTTVVSTIAGNYPRGQAGDSGDGGLGTSALLNDPEYVALDSANDLYILDKGNNVIREVFADTGIISTVAGQLPPATVGYSGDGGVATAAQLDSPMAIAVNPAGDLLIADSANLVVRKVNASTGLISTIAGVFNGAFNGTNATYTGDGGAATLGTFSFLLDIAVDSKGNLYLDDPFNDVVRKITAASGQLSFGSSVVGTASTPQSVTVTNNGNLSLNLFQLSIPPNFVADLANLNCSESAPVAPSGNCSLDFEFLPMTTGMLSGSATLTDSDPSLTQSVMMNGTGTPAPAVASKLSLTGVPATVAFGGTLGTVLVTVETSSGVVATSSTAAIVLSITGPDGFSQATTVSANSGIASFSFSSLFFTNPGAYTIVASSSGLTQAMGTFTVSAAPPLAAAKLALDGPPTTLPNGGTLGAVLVSVETGSGSMVATSTALVTITITGPGSFSRTVSSSAIAGLAAFDLATIMFDTPGMYILTASSAGLASATANFAVESAPQLAAKLAFSGLQAVLVQGGNLGTLSVSVESSSGTIISDSIAIITLEITGAGGYAKTLAMAANSGIAFFDLSLDLFAATGTYSITATSSGLVSATGSFTVNQGFIVEPAGGANGSNGSQTVIPGASAVYELTLAPAGSAFSLPITLTASGLPPGATYTFLPAVVTPGNAAATSRLTIQTARTTTTVHWPQSRAAGFGQVALALLLLPFAASRKLRKMARAMPSMGLVLALLSLGTIAGLTGCAAGGLFNFAPTRYTITVVGTSGSVVHTTTVTLIEQ